MNFLSKIDESVEAHMLGKRRAETPYRREDDKIKWRVTNNILFYEIIVVFFIAITFATLLGVWGVLRYDKVAINFFDRLNRELDNKAIYSVLGGSVNQKGQFVIHASNKTNGYCPGEELLYEYQWRSNRNAISAFYYSFKIEDEDRILWQSGAEAGKVVASQVNTTYIKRQSDSNDAAVIPNDFPIFDEEVDAYMLITAQSTTNQPSQIKVNFDLRERCSNE